jgi:membrane-bound metal-dependent hydrolase YbcI (DUF457 family)
MPSPLGHALAGMTAAWATDLIPGRRAWRTAPAAASWYQRAGDGLTMACAALGASPDLDLLVHHHRTVTHSIGATFVVALVAAAMAANQSRPIARVALMCAGAHLTHLLLDWMATDTYFPQGIQLLWPFSQSWYISGWDLFRQTARLHPLAAEEIVQNVKAIALEIAILGPVALGVWLVRVKALAGLASEMARRDHPTE